MKKRYEYQCTNPKILNKILNFSTLIKGNLISNVRTTSGFSILVYESAWHIYQLARSLRYYNSEKNFEDFMSLVRTRDRQNNIGESICCFP